jgi:hypothetical protein
LHVIVQSSPVWGRMKNSYQIYLEHASVQLAMLGQPAVCSRSPWGGMKDSYQLRKKRSSGVSGLPGLCLCGLYHCRLFGRMKDSYQQYTIIGFRWSRALDNGKACSSNGQVKDPASCNYMVVLAPVTFGSLGHSRVVHGAR